MGDPVAVNDEVFFDLGSGAGRLVAQAYLELPQLAGTWVRVRARVRVR